MLQVTDINWIAGFLEGEGSFVKTKGSIALQAVQARPELMDKLKFLLGGTTCISHQYGRDYYRWTLVGSNAAGLMMTLYSLMSSYRKGQIKKALQFWRSKKPANKFRTQCPQGHGYTQENTRIVNGSRICKQCEAIRKKKSSSKPEYLAHRRDLYRRKKNA
jgi:hypothetical protein